MERTRRALTTEARRHTSGRGLNGFTIEELCSVVGVSRRTFFNYFASKEDAVIGHRDDGLDPAAVEVFLAARPAGQVGISPWLLDDLLAMVISTLENFAIDVDVATSVEAVVAREPHMLGRFILEGAAMERVLTELVADREGIERSDHRAHMAVAIMHAQMRRAAALHFQPGNTGPFADHLLSAAEAAKALYAAALCAPRPQRPTHTEGSA